MYASTQTSRPHAVNYPDLVQPRKQCLIDERIDVGHRFIHSLTNDIYLVVYASCVYFRFGGGFSAVGAGSFFVYFRYTVKKVVGGNFRADRTATHGNSFGTFDIGDFHLNSEAVRIDGVAHFEFGKDHLVAGENHFVVVVLLLERYVFQLFCFGTCGKQISVGYFVAGEQLFHFSNNFIGLFFGFFHYFFRFFFRALQQLFPFVLQTSVQTFGFFSFFLQKFAFVFYCIQLFFVLLSDFVGVLQHPLKRQLFVGNVFPCKIYYVFAHSQFGGYCQGVGTAGHPHYQFVSRGKRLQVKFH